MRKRRRLLASLKNKSKQNAVKAKDEPDLSEKDVSDPRDRLKGALLDVLDPTTEESDSPTEHTPVKKERYNNQESQREPEDERHQRKKSPPRQAYVLKLFDRSVDLSQFEENSPLYPICRAWMINQPKSNYQEYGQSFEEPDESEDCVQLPGPQGPPISRIPEPLPEQKARSKDNINLNYRDGPLPTREQLLRSHTQRWAAVRQSWIDQAHKLESRYEATQQVLNKINVNII